MVDLIGPANALNITTARPAETRAFGGVDSWFKACTSQAAQDGTQLQAVWFNGMLAQLRNAIRGMGAAQDNSDNMLLRAIQAAQLRYGIDTGAANALVVTCSPVPVTSYTNFAGLVNIAAANTSTTPTINVDGLGPKTIVRSDGSPLVAGDLPGALAVAFMMYDGVKVRLMTIVTPPAAAKNGFIATASGLTVVPGSWNASSPMTANVKNTMGTSTFLNGVFTCGAGEGGWWAFDYHTAFFPTGTVATMDGWASLILGPNNQSEQTNMQAPPNAGNGAQCALIEELIPGNTVTFSSFRSTAGGGTGGGTMQNWVAGVRLGL